MWNERLWRQGRDMLCRDVLKELLAEDASGVIPEHYYYPVEAEFVWMVLPTEGDVVTVIARRAVENGGALRFVGALGHQVAAFATGQWKLFYPLEDAEVRTMAADAARWRAHVASLPPPPPPPTAERGEEIF